MSLQDELVRCVAAEWLDGNENGLTGDVSLVDLNIIDSAGIFDLVALLETRFGTAVPLDEVTPENFATIDSISALVQRLRLEPAR